MIVLICTILSVTPADVNVADSVMIGSNYELYAVPSSLIDEHGCLRKGNKSDLVKRLGVLETLPNTADAVIVDVSQLFYHIVFASWWQSLRLDCFYQESLSRYQSNAEKIIVFDKYQGVSVKDHERM